MSRLLQHGVQPAFGETLLFLVMQACQRHPRVASPPDASAWEDRQWQDRGRAADRQEPSPKSALGLLPHPRGEMEATHVRIAQMGSRPGWRCAS
jgi:hypothetical protein